MSGYLKFLDNRVLIPLLTGTFRNVRGRWVNVGYYSGRVEDERGMVPLIAMWLPEVGCTMPKGNGTLIVKVSIQNDFFI